MLSSSDRSIEEVLAYFTAHSIEVGLLVPTRTGLEKSIMDAHADLRDFLRIAGVHDYEHQIQGPSGKAILDATFLGTLDTRRIQVSLYRPETKKGDPRIWIRGLTKLVRAGNLLALFVIDGHLYVTNTSDPETWEAREDPDSPLGDVVTSFHSEEDLIASELLDKLTAIARLGWVRSLRRGDTGIGFTLETLLGIRANARPEPDYKGIELKSARANRGGRNNLFAKTPDWSRSPIRSSRQLLTEYGYFAPEKARDQLFATVYGSHAGPGGFQLDVTERDVWLQNLAMGRSRDLAVWSRETLQESLMQKHSSTFWIKAETRTASDGTEEFLFQTVRYTRGPVISAFIPLIEAGGVTMDLTCFTDGERTKDKGYLWKVAPKSFAALFPQAQDYVL